jgi:hypothetical protein
MKKTTAYLLDETENGFVAWKSDQIAHSKGTLGFMGGQCLIQPMKDGRWHIMNGPTHRWHIADQLDYFEWQVLKAFCNMAEEDQWRFRTYMMSRVKRIQEVFQYLPKNNVSWKNSFLIAFSQLQQEYAA